MPLYTIRFTDDEMARLREMADGRPVSAVIRRAVFGPAPRSGVQEVAVPAAVPGPRSEAPVPYSKARQAGRTR